MLSHLITACLVILPFAQCQEVHHHMNEEEFQMTFGTGSDNVPEYEVVRIFHNLHKRDINDNSPRTIIYNADGTEMSLYLEPTEGLLAGESTPVWSVKNVWNYELHPNVFANVGRAYQSVTNMSSIIVYPDDDGETLIYGELMKNKIVRPLPCRLRNIARREARDLADLPNGVDGSADLRPTNYHVIFERHERDINANDANIQVVEQTNRISRATENGEHTADIVYPELLILVDFVIYESLGKNLENVARYVLAFVNAIDLRYRSVESPMIRFNIAGLLIQVSNTPLPYSIHIPTGESKQSVENILYAMGVYFYREFERFPFESYDIAMTLTGVKLIAGEDGEKSSVDSSGMSSGACSVNRVAKRIKSTAVIYDNGGFYGILNAAHEIGHLMGVYYDGYGNNIDCPAEDAYLMSSAKIMHRNNFKLSECSLRNLVFFLSLPHSNCLRNKPQAGRAIPRILPGKLQTLDEQCKKWQGPDSEACYHDRRVCATLKCTSSITNSCEVFRGAAEGSSCGNEMHCINGYCVSKDTENVPHGNAIIDIRTRDK